MKISLFKIGFFTILFLASCSKKNADTPTQKHDLKKAHTIIPSANISDIVVFGKSRLIQDPIASLNRQNNVVADVQSLLKPLTGNGDIITTIKVGWNSFNHPSFTVVEDPKDWMTAFEGNPDSLALEIRDPHSLWSKDKELQRAVIGRFALMTGLFGAGGNSVSHFPRLLSESAQHAAVTREDLLTLRIVRQAVGFSENRSNLVASDLPGWNKLAASQNPAYRAVALIAFNAMRSTPEQQTSFYQAYATEGNVQVAKLYVEQVGSSDLHSAESLLRQFAASSSAATQLSGLIEQKINISSQHSK